MIRNRKHILISERLYERIRIAAKERGVAMSRLLDEILSDERLRNAGVLQ